MTSLILHVGPPKCGSTSIQQFFAMHKSPCVETTHYMMLDPSDIVDLNREEPGESLLHKFTQLFEGNLTKTDVLILSHESLFQCPYTIKHICNSAKNVATKISIIGYSRRQSEFMVSAYSQWDFRLHGRIEEAANVLKRFELEPALFSGLEQQLIALIMNDFHDHKYGEYKICDWYRSYSEIAQSTLELGTEIKCGILPAKGAHKTLIDDFCEKSGLHLRAEIKAATWPVFNPSFNPDLVEAINNAVAFGLDMPGLHENNEILELLSGNMVNTPGNTAEFLSNLKSYVDSYFLSSNQQFCREYGLTETYFAPPKQFSKQEICDLILQEAQQRALNPSMIINNYRRLSAQTIELCLKLARENIDIREHMSARLYTKLKALGILGRLRKFINY